MKRANKIVLWGVVAICVCFALPYLPLWPFYPVYLVMGKSTGRQLIERNTPLTKRDAAMVCVVLNDHGVLHWRVGNCILIASWLARDKELRWNFTMKADVDLHDSQYRIKDNKDGTPPTWVGFRAPEEGAILSGK